MAPSRLRLGPTLLAALGTLLLPAGALVFPAPAGAGVLEGEIVAVHDGDTVTLRSGDETIRVRLAGIDTPERGQPWSRRSKQALSDRVFGKEVRIIEVAVDAYGRTVGEIYAEDVCVGCELVRDGHAWVYRRYSQDAVLLSLEAEARAAGRGLWSLPESQRIPPWEWRRGKAARERATGCGAKRTCKEMTDCAEARFHLEQCGLTHLDGDGDGNPCDELCDRR